MYGFVLTWHSLIRWAVVLLGLAAVARALAGWLGRKAWSAADDRGGLFFVISFDLQVLVGLVLYVFASQITTSAFQTMSGAMQNAVVRFWVVEHPTAMLIGLALAHVGRARVRRASDPAPKHRRAAILFGFALLLVALGTPWPFMPVARPWWPF